MTWQDGLDARAGAHRKLLSTQRPTTRLQSIVEDEVDPAESVDSVKSSNGTRSQRSSIADFPHNGGLSPKTDAWIVGHSKRIGYDVDTLTTGLPIPDLWDETGTCLVYFSHHRGPSFRINPLILAASSILSRAVFGVQSINNNAPHSADPNYAAIGATSYRQTRSTSAYSSHSDSSRATPPIPGQVPPYALRFDIALGRDNDNNKRPRRKGSQATTRAQGLERIIALRNLLAFLSGRPLVATREHPTVFAVMLRISRLLRAYRFTNRDASSYGESVTSRFECYVKELGLADVRHSREKTIEAIVLGERMRSPLLYNEAFTHAVGKYEEMQTLKSSKFALISPITVNRLGRAAIDLEKRIASVRLSLKEFIFPSIISSMTRDRADDEHNLIDYDAWRNAFDAMRKFVMGYYRRFYGSWPPKASSKKNDLRTNGLNRAVLRKVYTDLGDLYDLLVNRNKMTNRTADGVIVLDGSKDRPAILALRHVLSQYDRSSPPVKPPMPFDLPRLPTIKTIGRDFGSSSDKRHDVRLLGKKLRGNDARHVLSASHNRGTKPTEFLDAFLMFEMKAAQGRTISTFIDQRMGQWIFLYAVLQSLPMLVVDAPGLTYTDDVEYFLCSRPRSGVPWAADSGGRREMKWYNVAGSGGLVNLPTDVLETSVDGVYRRSHCWLAADRWTAKDSLLNSAMHKQQYTFSPQALDGKDLANVNTPDVRSAADTPRHASSQQAFTFDSRASRRPVMHVGLEALAVPPDARPEEYTNMSKRHPVDDERDTGRERRRTMTFDGILGNSDRINRLSDAK